MIKSSGKLKYVELESGGYKIVEPWWIRWDKFPKDWNCELNDKTARIFNGMMIVEVNFRFDGGSGPAIDKGGMHGYLPHDVWYRLARQSKIPQSTRPLADKLMYECHRELDHMNWFRAQYLWLGVRIGGASSFAVQPDKESIVKSV